jgi:hypothetical protein
MTIDTAAVRKCLKSFDFSTLFREHLGWDKHQATLDVPVDGSTVRLSAVAQKRGFVAFVCPSIPDRAIRLKIDHQVTKSAHEHFVIYTDQPGGQQVWHWVRREPGKPLASRDHRFDAAQSGDPLIQRLNQIAVSIDEEESITVVDVAGRARAAFDVDKVTKKFYERFKAEHAGFMKFIKGIKAEADLQWYTSLMLNRLMFVYFIQKKGFLDGDTDYLRNRMRLVRESKGKDKFLSFYRYFLLRLFHDGLGKAPDERKLDREMEKMLGKVPFLNGGFFEVHQLEERNPDIDIPDKAFEKLFDFFDDFRWHLDERPLRADNEINPDVVGYIFEKYINQKQMGAYYTKEDITEYISKNTVIPFLFDAAENKCPIAFKPDSFLWRLLRDDPDRYIYAAVRHGVLRPRTPLTDLSDPSDSFDPSDPSDILPLPADIAAGLNDVSKRDGWNRPAAEPYGLPTETWREHVARRNRCLELRQKLKSGEVHAINDLVTLNLDIWQFARDAIVNSEGPELLRAFWHAIEKVTVLDPTCGSGAFLFAALRILESLYSDCLERMERFVEDHDSLAPSPRSRGEGRGEGSDGVKPQPFWDFRKILDQIADQPSDKYFILKSIIINNLFGVDIMEEAVEICKLRLFLKLVAQVETADQIKPLPDIDFNIRAGNTLVGYVSLDQVRKSQEGTLGFGAKEVKRIEEDALAVEKCFEQFRAQQTKHGGKVTTKDKQELRRRLQKLDAELDRYLASEYAIAADNFKTKAAFEEAFAKWKTSHEPFHWFVEFYGIMASGGFDVIVGNPPYVEWQKVTSYDVLPNTLQTRGCGNLYSCMSERSCDLLIHPGRMGMIIPVSCVSTDRMGALRKAWRSKTTECWLSYYSGDAHPSVLFPGVKFRLCIALHARHHRETPFLCSGRYARWLPDERSFLFPLQCYATVPTSIVRDGLVPKLGCQTIANVLEKVIRDRSVLGEWITKDAQYEVYCHRIVAHFMKAMDFVPFFRNDRDGEKKSEDYKVFPVAKTDLRAVLAAVLNSNLFYWYYLAYSDVYHCGRELILGFPCDLGKLQKARGPELAALNAALMKDLRKHSVRRRIPYKTTGFVEYDEYYPRSSKPIIDEIDRILARHYGFTDDELDFIINYDIKYRMGGSDDEGDE